MKEQSRQRGRHFWIVFFVSYGILLTWIATAWWFHYGGGQTVSTGHFTILQINDVYRIEGIERRQRGGLSRVRSLRQSLEKEGREVLVLHAGDALSPSVMSKYLHGQPMIRALNLLDGDPQAFDDRLVATFGNHEFDDDWPDLLLSRLLESDFTWVSTHVRYRWQGPNPYFSP